MQAIEEAVKRANLVYLTARGHVVIISEADYPVVQGAEAAGGAAETVVCELWERCWCVLEMVVRYLAEQQVRRQRPPQQTFAPPIVTSALTALSAFTAGCSLCPLSLRNQFILTSRACLPRLCRGRRGRS